MCSTFSNDIYHTLAIQKIDIISHKHTQIISLAIKKMDLTKLTYLINGAIFEANSELGTGFLISSATVGRGMRLCPSVWVCG